MEWVGVEVGVEVDEGRPAVPPPDEVPVADRLSAKEIAVAGGLPSELDLLDQG